MSPITINGNIVDLDTNHPKNALFSLNASAADSDYILVQTKDDLSKREKAELQQLGAVLQEYIADNVYLFQYKPTRLESIRDKPFVVKAGVYAKGLKINADLKTTTAVAPYDSRTVSVVLHEDKDQAPAEIIGELANAAGVSRDQIMMDGNKAKLTVEPDKISILAAVDSVRTIEAAPNRVLFNDVARNILDAEIVLNDTQYQGSGQVVAVGDTGFDKGNLADVHPAFTGRVKDLIDIGRQSLTNDTAGHGTHVCGSILGGSIPGSSQSSVRGIAPKAELVVQSLLNEKKGLFPTRESGRIYPLTKLFTEPYEKYHACIHSNSWGAEWDDADGQRPYDDLSKEIDTCVWKNPELLICFAAGNDGARQRTPTLGSEAASKNVLTIGATESTRPSFGATLDPSKKSANDATEVSFYSSRGPTKEQRIKPDVVAPGTTILSTKSRDAPKDSSYGNSPDPLLTYSSGTSMATPLVAGCATILREVLLKNGVEKPSAALIKALLINGAFSFHHAHSGNEGFGRVNLKNSIIIPGTDSNAGFLMGEPLTDRDERKSIDVSIPARAPAVASSSNNDTVDALRVTPPGGKGVTLKATLVYTDAPGARLQNDLNLIVTTSDGARRNGNMGTSDKYDTSNNVEQVVWRGIPAGNAKITVRAQRVTSDAQDFALVWRVIPNED